MTCILTEQRIVFFSSDWALLTLIAECFMLYLHPLQWQHTFVPLLSRQMLDFVMAPTSFLMGCHIDHFEEVSTVCFRLLLVLLFTCSAFDPLLLSDASRNLLLLFTCVRSEEIRGNGTILM